MSRGTASTVLAAQSVLLVLSVISEAPVKPFLPNLEMGVPMRNAVLSPDRASLECWVSTPELLRCSAFRWDHFQTIADGAFSSVTLMVSPCLLLWPMPGSRLVSPPTKISQAFSHRGFSFLLFMPCFASDGSPLRSGYFHCWYWLGLWYERFLTLLFSEYTCSCHSPVFHL